MRPVTEPMGLEDDRAWLDAFRRGDRAALARVYRSYVDGVAGLLRRGFEFSSGGRACRFRGVRSEAELEDRVQEVFARALSERARLAYDGLTPYRAYLNTIARNLVIDDFRRAERRMVAFTWEPPDRPTEGSTERPSEPLGGLFAPSGDPAEDLTRRQLAATIEATVGALPPREQSVYRLRFVEELEHADIATRTGLTPAKVKTSEARIRRAFFHALRRQGHLEGYEERPRGWLRRIVPAGGRR